MMDLSKTELRTILDIIDQCLSITGALGEGFLKGEECVCHDQSTKIFTNVLIPARIDKIADNRDYAILDYVLPHLQETARRFISSVAIYEAKINNEIKITQEAHKSLTSREQEILKWATLGKTSWEIGKILSITERTVKFHFKNMYRKLDVVNRSQAVAKAVSGGLVDL